MVRCLYIQLDAIDALGNDATMHRRRCTLPRNTEGKQPETGGMMSYLVTQKLARKKAAEAERKRCCLEAWKLYPPGMSKNELVAAVKANGKDEATKAAAKTSVRNDDLRRMLHVALGVPVGAAEGVTTVEEFLGWVEAQAAVAGEAAVRAIGEPPVPMVVVEENRPAAEVMEEEDNEVAAEEDPPLWLRRAGAGHHPEP